MSRKSFYVLCDMLRPYLEKKRTRLRTPMSLQAQVGSFFIILVTNVMEKPKYFANF